MIERAYTEAKVQGLCVWTEDEAGPFQAIPQPGCGWHEVSRPSRYPHEYIRGGTAKLLTLYSSGHGPGTGEQDAKECECGAAPLAERAAYGDSL